MAKGQWLRPTLANPSGRRAGVGVLFVGCDVLLEGVVVVDQGLKGQVWP